MTSDLDAYRTALILVKEYGAEQASLMAATRADALLDLGDVDGQRAWKAVLRAVQELFVATSYTPVLVTDPSTLRQRMILPSTSELSSDIWVRSPVAVAIAIVLLG
jgi:hypothetical protein